MRARAGSSPFLGLYQQPELASSHNLIRVVVQLYEDNKGVTICCPYICF